MEFEEEVLRAHSLHSRAMGKRFGTNRPQRRAAYRNETGSSGSKTVFVIVLAMGVFGLIGSSVFMSDSKRLYTLANVPPRGKSKPQIQDLDAKLAVLKPAADVYRRRGWKLAPAEQEDYENILIETVVLMSSRIMLLSKRQRSKLQAATYKAAQAWAFGPDFFWQHDGRNAGKRLTHDVFMMSIEKTYPDVFLPHAEQAWEHASSRMRNKTMLDSRGVVELFVNMSAGIVDAVRVPVPAPSALLLARAAANSGGGGGGVDAVTMDDEGAACVDERSRCDSGDGAPSVCEGGCSAGSAADDDDARPP